MNNCLVFDNEGRTADRYTIVDRESGDVFAVDLNKDGNITGSYCGNCAQHRITLYGSGWRQMPLSQRIIETETDNYIRNAQLNPGWLGRELPREEWPMDLLDYIVSLNKTQQKDLHKMPGMPYLGLQNDDGWLSKTAIAI